MDVKSKRLRGGVQYTISIEDAKNGCHADGTNFPKRMQRRGDGMILDDNDDDSTNTYELGYEKI